MAVGPRLPLPCSGPRAALGCPRWASAPDWARVTAHLVPLLGHHLRDASLFAIIRQVMEVTATLPQHLHHARETPVDQREVSGTAIFTQVAWQAVASPSSRTATTRSASRAPAPAGPPPASRRPPPIRDAA